MIAVVTTAGAAQLTGRPLQPQGCYASLTRPPFGRPLTLEPLSTLRQDQRQATACPLPTRHPSSPEPEPEPEPEKARSTTNPRGTRGPLRFLARMSSITWDRNVKHQVRPDTPWDTPVRSRLMLDVAVSGHP